MENTFLKLDELFAKVCLVPIAEEKFEVIRFINSHYSDWQELLAAEPYNISIKSDGEYYILKYNMLSSDFNLKIARECRGMIIKEWKSLKKFYPVSVAFEKFGNYGESYVPELDWESAYVTEKVDGSLMRVWYDNGWHISTNGSIDAFKAQIGDTNLTFGEAFMECLPVDDLNTVFDPYLMYIFEFVSPESKVVIPYQEKAIYLIGARSRINYCEVPFEKFNHLTKYRVKFPKSYNLHNLDECIKAAKELDWKHEGFVVRDRYFNRVKIKSPEYLIAHKSANNGVITNSKILDMMLDGSIDDFLAYFPEFTNRVEFFLRAYQVLVETITHEFDTIDWNNFASRAEMAETVKKSKYSGFLFRKYTNKDLSADEWLRTLPRKKVLQMMEGLE